MTVFLTTGALFLIALIFHLILWRVRLPKNHIRTLLILFSLVFGLWLLASMTGDLSMGEHLQIALYYAAVSLCYVITYSAIEGDSPTLSLMLHLFHHGVEGIRVEEVVTFLAQRPFVKARIAALETSGLVREQNGNYVIAGKPSLFFRIILGYRKLYGPVSKGG